MTGEIPVLWCDGPVLSGLGRTGLQTVSSVIPPYTADVMQHRQSAMLALSLILFRLNDH
jgi:hypothetical protein